MTTGRINQVTAAGWGPARAGRGFRELQLESRCVLDVEQQCVLARVSHLSVSPLCAGVRAQQRMLARIAWGPADRRLRCTGTSFRLCGSEGDRRQSARLALPFWFAVPSVRLARF